MDNKKHKEMLSKMAEVQEAHRVMCDEQDEAQMSTRTVGDVAKRMALITDRLDEIKSEYYDEEGFEL